MYVVSLPKSVFNYAYTDLLPEFTDFHILT